ncbi:MAG: hypothetical protein EOP84_01985 [Verrucomicrobiaceae bacterium]|nr:MAG: hypothetical protein EOP84_01985 [Verrucomicrobiaceae bacterium]
MDPKLLQARKAKLFHATNLRDFSSYINEGGILSRNLLERHPEGFTEFFSDQKDKYLGVWNRSFGNLNDFGKYFWDRENSTPNAYGPITIVMGHRVWPGFPDLKITDRTITSSSHRELNDNDIDSIFVEKDGRFFLRSGYTGCEASTSLERLGFGDLAYVLVDPLEFNGRSLLDMVKEVSSPLIRPTQILERSVKMKSQLETYGLLIQWSLLLKGKLLRDNEDLRDSLPDNLIKWFDGLDGWKRSIMASWLTYTYNGTLSKMTEE